MIMETQVQQLLKQNQLSVTGSRVKILELFLQNNGALAHGDIEKKTGEKFDRVTIYRTLQTFMEKGIIHLIPTTDNNVRYALCKDNCSEGHHHDNHVHFVCDECGTTICLEEVTVPEVKLPKGFKPHQAEMVVNGVCKDCK
ncbi:MAG: Fur family transcriptional regulator [Chitinophagaceae bacterium]|nr:transcriptional repressor [Parasegetibacter sp. NRK P23]